MSQITPQISGNFIVRVAEVYTDFHRAIMEYIDNSIDSAENFYKNGKYEKPIEIGLKIIESREQIIITDNCTGIEDLNTLIEKIGASDKRNDYVTNGQFGFGIYSFMAGCNKIEFYSKTKNQNEGFYLSIPKRKFEKNKLSDVQIDSAEKRDSISVGTKVILSQFEKRIWNEIEPEKIKKEIESHFEVLLKRENLVIKVNEEQCKPYNYEEIKGEPYEVETPITLTYIAKKRKVGDLPPKNIQLKTPIQIYLRLSEGREIKKPPVFFIKGRRLNEIKNIHSFTSIYGSKNILWGHSLITGYIDLKDNFEPTITRDRFKSTDTLKAFFQYLNKEIEPYIYEIFIKEKNKERMDDGYKSFALILEDLLAKLLKEDFLNYRKKGYSSEGETGLVLKEGFGSKDSGERNRSNEKNNFGKNEGDGIGPSSEKGKDIYEDDKEEKTKRSGLQIEFTEQELVEDNKGKKLKSTINDNIDGTKTIKIYTQHPNYKERLDTSSTKGEIKFSARLISYLSGQLAIYCRDEYYKKIKQQPEANQDLFVDVVDFIYKIETVLSPYIGCPISVITNNG